MSAPESSAASELDYLCVGICLNDAESGYCLGCGRPPAPIFEPKTAVDEVGRYPVAGELLLRSDPER